MRLFLFAAAMLSLSACSFPECLSFDNSALTDELQRTAERDTHCARGALTVQSISLAGGITHLATGCGLQARYTCRWSRNTKQCRVDEVKCELRGCGRSRFLTSEKDILPECPAPDRE